MAARGFDYAVSQIKGQTETVIGQGHSDAVMESGESESFAVPWTVPEDVSDTRIKVAVTESGIAGSKPVMAEKAVPYGSALCFEDAQVLWKGNAPYVETRLINKGNKASGACSGTLSMVDGDNKEVKTYKKFDIPGLASGESKTFELPFSPAVDDFSPLGVIDLKIAASDGKGIAEESYARLVSSSPVCAQINGGEKEIKLECGKTNALKVKAAPWEKIAGEARFYSSNEGVAVVDQKGIVTGTGSGKAKIYAYYASAGVSASVDVSVSAQGGNQPPSGTAKPGASAATKKLTVKKKAVKGSAATVTLKSKNGAGKTVKASIKVKVQNKAKKIAPAKKSITVKKGKKAKLVLKVTAQNKKKATTDAVKVSSSLKGKKKGSKKITVKVGSKKVKVKARVR